MPGQRHSSFRNYADLVEYFKRQHGDRFDDSELYSQFRPWVGYRGRIEISGEHFANRRRTGYLGVTSGWRPAFMLVSRSNATGSSDLLRRDDHVIARQLSDGKYHPVSGRGALGWSGMSRRRHAAGRAARRTEHGRHAATAHRHSHGRTR
jgi:hypothetical protein